MSFLLTIEGDDQLNKTLASHAPLRPKKSFFSHINILKNVPYNGRIKILSDEADLLKFPMMTIPENLIILQINTKILCRITLPFSRILASKFSNTIDAISLSNMGRIC